MANTDEYLRGLQEVRVSKDKLLGVIRDNRKQHAEQFDAALTGWKVEVVEKLERDLANQKKTYRRLIKDQKKLMAEMSARIKRAQADDFRTDASHFGIAKPAHHISDYDGAIKKLELSLDTELELSTLDFDTFVMDKWIWKSAFDTSYQHGTFYLNNALSNGTITTTCNSNVFTTGSIATHLITSGSLFNAY